jgi:poly-gamma-glutamate synthesis protein (capsule biosynthesis protein)
VPIVPLLLLGLLAAVRGGEPLERRVSFAAVGDIQLGMALRAENQLPGGDPFALVRPPLEADLTVGNLEGPIAAPWAEEARGAHGPHLRQPADAADHLRAAGFDLVSLANNHVLDYGIPAVGSTLAALRRAGVDAAGAWEDPASRFQPVLRTVNGLTIGFLSYTMWLNVAGGRETIGLGHFKTDDAVAEVAALRPYVDFVVVLVHWERENDHFTYGSTRDLAHALVDAGADVVLGHHAHVLKGLEWYRGALIAYSLGNFVFGAVRGPLAQSGVLRFELALGLDGRRSVRDVRIVPVTLDGPRSIPRVARGPRATRILALLRRIARPLDTFVDRDGSVLPRHPARTLGLAPRIRSLLVAR